MAKRHFSAKKNPSAPGGSTTLPLTTLDYTLFLGRILFTSVFIYSLLYNIANIDKAAEELIHLWGVPSSLAFSATIISLVLSFIGCALFFISPDPYGIYLLLIFLIPSTLIHHVVPLLSIPSSSPHYHAAIIHLLKNVALIGALIIIMCYMEQIEYLETESREEVKQALLAFYEKQGEQQRGGGSEEKIEGKTATTATATEPKKRK